MKAEDTILSQGEVEEHYASNHDWGLRPKEIYPDRWGREIQAKVSFKAGIKEVVEWIENNTERDGNDFTFCPIEEVWQVKLKEWGIE